MSQVPVPVPITVTLNPAGVTAPALNSMRRASEMVAFTMNNIAGADLSAAPRPLGGKLFQLSFGMQPPGYDRRADFIDWILERGFRDLAHGIRGSLEEAYFYIKVGSAKPQAMTWGGLQEHIAKIRKEANGHNFPNLLAAVNEGLSAPLSFAREFQSLYDVRNCLEHYRGLVPEKYASSEKGMLLALPRLKVFFLQGGQEIELEAGQLFEEETEINARLETIERFLPVGSRVTFTAAEFVEVATACLFFTNDLGEKLPKIVGRPSNQA